MPEQATWLLNAGELDITQMRILGHCCSHGKEDGKQRRERVRALHHQLSMQLQGFTSSKKKCCYLARGSFKIELSPCCLGEQVLERCLPVGPLRTLMTEEAWEPLP